MALSDISIELVRAKSNFPITSLLTLSHLSVASSQSITMTFIRSQSLFDSTIRVHFILKLKPIVQRIGNNRHRKWRAHYSETVKVVSVFVSGKKSQWLKAFHEITFQMNSQ